MLSSHPLRSALFGTAFAASVALTPKTALAEVILNDEVPIDTITDNPCNGELVLIQGKAHELLRVTENGGTYHFGRHFNAAGVTGVGLTSGARYVLSAAFNDEFTLAAGSTSTTVQALQVIGVGRTPNFTLHVLFHVTVDANGDVHAYVEKERAECR